MTLNPQSLARAAIRAYLAAQAEVQHVHSR